MIKGVDLSQWNEGLTIAAVKKAGFEFAILRAGFTGYAKNRPKKKDEIFENLYKQAQAAKMPVGAYWYSCANDRASGEAEAKFMLENCLKGKKFEYPIYIDVEEKRWQDNNRKGVTDAIIGFCEYLTKKGYYAGVYASTSWFGNQIDTARLSSFTKWVANWSSKKPAFKYNHFDIWQNSSDGKINGFRVDTNVDYYGKFPELMLKHGLNGFKKKTPAPTPKPAPAPAKKPYSNGAESFNDKYKNGKAYTVTAKSSLRLRKKPVNGATVAYMPNGAKVMWYGFYTKVDGVVWRYVQYKANGKSIDGFCSSKYLK